MEALRRFLAWSFALPLALSALTMSAASCSSDEGGDPDLDAVAWVSPTADSRLQVGETVELTVKVNDPSANIVRFNVDDGLLATCDTSRAPDECRRGDLFRATKKFDRAGHYTLSAIVPTETGEKLASLSIEVHAASSSPPGDDGPDDEVVDAAAPDGGTKPKPTNRGFLDPDRALHNVFGGVSWAVKSQKVEVASPPAGAVSAVAACMKSYGASIIKHADANKISRASVVATAITESNCTNPKGSSDGLSSGPMQVTGSTCASLVSGYTSAQCKAKMYSDPDFSFLVGAKYMGSSYQLGQHGRDPPKIAAAYNAGSIRKSTANRWHMVVTGNHIDRFVGAYNAYRAWETMNGVAMATLSSEVETWPAARFEGEHVTSMEALPNDAAEGQVYFVGDWERRDGAFVRRRDGAWHAD